MTLEQLMANQSQYKLEVNTLDLMKQLNNCKEVYGRMNSKI